MASALPRVRVRDRSKDRTRARARVKVGIRGVWDTGYPHATKLSRGACLRTKVRSHGSPMILVRTGGCACDERYCEYTARVSNPHPQLQP